MDSPQPFPGRALSVPLVVLLVGCCALAGCSDGAESGEEEPPEDERYEQPFDTEALVRGEEFGLAFLSEDWRFIAFWKSPTWDNPVPLYVYDTHTGTRQRLEGAVRSTHIWESADGQRLYYRQDAQEGGILRVWPAGDFDDGVIAEDVRWVSYREEYDIFFGERGDEIYGPHYSWTAETGEETQLAEKVKEYAYGPNGRLVLLGDLIGSDENVREVRLWDAKTNRVIPITSDPKSVYSDFGFVGTDGRISHVYYVKSARAERSSEGKELHVYRLSDGHHKMLDRDLYMQEVEDKGAEEQKVLDRLFWLAEQPGEEDSIGRPPYALASWDTASGEVRIVGDNVRPVAPYLKVSSDQRLALFYRKPPRERHHDNPLAAYDFREEKEYLLEENAAHDSAHFLPELPVVRYRLSNEAPGEQYRIWHADTLATFEMTSMDRFGTGVVGTVADQQSALLYGALFPGEEDDAVFALDFDDHTLTRLTPAYPEIATCTGLVSPDGRRFLYASREREEHPLRLWLHDRSTDTSIDLDELGNRRRCGTAEASQDWERGYFWAGGSYAREHLYPLLAWRGEQSVDPADGLLVSRVYRPEGWQRLVVASGHDKEAKIGTVSRYSYVDDRTDVLAEPVRLRSVEASEELETLAYLGHTDARRCRRSCSNDYCSSNDICSYPAFALDRPAAERAALPFELGPYAERILAVGDGVVLWVSSATSQGDYGRQSRQLMLSRRR